MSWKSGWSLSSRVRPPFFGAGAGAIVSGDTASSLGAFAAPFAATLIFGDGVVAGFSAWAAFAACVALAVLTVLTALSAFSALTGTEALAALGVLAALAACAVWLARLARAG